MKREVNPQYKKIKLNPGENRFSDFNAADVGKGAAAGAAVGTAIPVVGTVVGGAVGAVGGLIGSIFGGGSSKPDPASADFQKQLLNERNAIVVNPTMANILAHNDLIRANFQTLDQAKQHTGGLGPYALFIWPKNPTGADNFFRADKGINTPANPTYADLAINQGNTWAPVNVDTIINSLLQANTAATTTTNTGAPQTGNALKTAVVYDASGNPILQAKDNTLIYVIIGATVIVVIALAVFMMRNKK